MVNLSQFRRPTCFLSEATNLPRQILNIIDKSEAHSKVQTVFFPVRCVMALTMTARKKLKRRKRWRRRRKSQASSGEKRIETKHFEVLVVAKRWDFSHEIFPHLLSPPVWSEISPNFLASIFPSKFVHQKLAKIGQDWTQMVNGESPSLISTILFPSALKCICGLSSAPEEGIEQGDPSKCNQP